MPRSERALLLDLDDTLYPQRRFLMSGFAAVARHVADTFGADATRAFGVLMASYRGADRRHELDRLVQELGLPVSVEALVDVVRSHTPSLTLRPSIRRTLLLLRESWRLGIVTNGLPSIQAAKVAALGVDRLVDTVVYAAEHGSGTGKPERDPFLEALRRLETSAADAIFVGDDGHADILGATACGIQTIQTFQWKRASRASIASRATAVVHGLLEIPAVADRVFAGRRNQHAA